MKTRKIIHIDMDAFYASVEQRDNPSLKGKPVIVGGKPGDRGVVAACSYEARKFGVRSAMSTAKAVRLCPSAVIIKPDFTKYTAVSRVIHEVFTEYTDLIEPVSLDEAYLDVTENKKNTDSATQIAGEIRSKIRERTGLTASAGVSYNKFIAKVASDENKPDGITVVRPEDADRFISSLPIRKFHGIGKVTEKKMAALGIRTGADLKKHEKQRLIGHFGKAGGYFYDLARGVDNSPVEPDGERKSLGKEITLREDIDEQERIIEILEKIAFEVEHGLKEEKLKGKTITLKVKYHDFESITRAKSLDGYFDDADTMMDTSRELLKKTKAGKKKIRLLGISVSNFENAGNRQKKPGTLF